MEHSKQNFSKRNYATQPEANYPDYRSTVLRHQQHKLVVLPQSIADMTGPVFGHMDLGDKDHDLIINYASTGKSAIGERIVVRGKVLDESGKPVPNALIEVWQANAGGRYRHKNDSYLAPLDPNFGGCGRCLTDSDGNYSFRTIKPGPYPWPNGGNDWRPAHIHFSIFGQAFAQRLITQMYFEGDPHIGICPIVQSIGDGRAIEQLVARLDMAHSVPMDLRAYRFDIVLRGPDATMFEKN
jgi:protocatechuate 3,4-dioxygenase beta subunit